EALATVAEYVAIAAAFVMKELARLRAALQVVGGNGFYGPTLPGFRFSIRNRFCCGHGLYDGRRGHDLPPRLAYRPDLIRVHVVAMNVGDQDQVGLRLAGEIHGFGRIQIDELAACLDQCTGVVQRSDAHWSG